MQKNQKAAKGKANKMAQYTKDLNKVIAGLKKASKLHLGQAKVLEKMKKDQAKEKKSPRRKRK